MTQFHSFQDILNKVYDETTQSLKVHKDADGSSVSTYTLPPATALALGGIKVGANLSITDDGTLSADAQAFDLAKALTIGDNGNWFIDGQDTGTKAQGDKGDTGATGATGAACSLTIGTVSSGTTASATITGTAPNQTLSLTLPKGDKGDKGTTGEKGDKGEDGFSPTITVTNTESGKNFTITNADGTPTSFEITNGKDGADGKDGAKGTDGKDGTNGADGKDGADGADGKAATIAEVTVTTGAAGTEASVENTGTETEAKLHFTIPRGATGEAGKNGEQGEKGADGKDGTSVTVSTSQTDTGATITLTDSAGEHTIELTNGKDGNKGEQGIQGDKGKDGITPNFAEVNVTTLAAGTSATASISGDADSLTLNLGIPRGADGSSAVYTLPTASSSTLGGVKIGDGLSIDSSTGVLQVSDTTLANINDTSTIANTALSAAESAEQLINSHSSNSSIHIPTTGTTGYVLTKTDSGSEWKEAQSSSVAEIKPVTKWKVSPDSTYNTEYFALRSTVQQANNDIVIDWGDGSTTVLKEASVIEYSIALESDSDVNNHSSELQDNSDLKPTVYTGEWESDGELAFGFYHKYTTTGTYTVTITGSDYFGISRNFSYIYGRNKLTIEGASIISECLTDELPLAQNVTNLSMFAFESVKLTSIQIPTGMNLDRIDNWYSCFSTCSNLTSATGFKYKLFNAKQISNLFYECQKLETCDLVLPPVIKYKNALNQAFFNCYALTGDISKFFAEAGLLCVGKAEMTNTFYSCRSLTGTIPVEYLWNNPNVEWDYPMEDGTSNTCFTYCSDALRAQAPVSWGGTASNDIINTGSSSYELPPATALALGGIKVGANLSITDDGTLSADGSGASTYTLPAATTSALGGVKVGSNLSVTSDGTLSLASTITSQISSANTNASAAMSAAGTASATASSVSSSLNTHTSDSSIHVPTSGTAGQILTKTSSGSAWQDAPESGSDNVVEKLSAEFTPTADELGHVYLWTADDTDAMKKGHLYKVSSREVTTTTESSGSTEGFTISGSNNSAYGSFDGTYTPYKTGQGYAGMVCIIGSGVADETNRTSNIVTTCYANEDKTKFIFEELYLGTIQWIIHTAETLNNSSPPRCCATAHAWNSTSNGYVYYDPTIEQLAELPWTGGYESTSYTVTTFTKGTWTPLSGSSTTTTTSTEYYLEDITVECPVVNAYKEATDTVVYPSLKPYKITADDVTYIGAGGGVADSVAYAELVVTVGSSGSVLAGDNLTLVDSLTAGKTNYCVVRWDGTTANLFVWRTE